MEMEISLRRMSLCNLLLSWQFTFQIFPPQGAVSFFVEHRFHRLYRFLYPSFFQSKGIPPCSLLRQTSYLNRVCGLRVRVSQCPRWCIVLIHHPLWRLSPKSPKGVAICYPLCSLLHKTIALIWGGGSMGIAAVVNHDTVKPHPWIRELVVC